MPAAAQAEQLGAEAVQAHYPGVADCGDHLADLVGVLAAAHRPDPDKRFGGEVDTRGAVHADVVEVC
jgi:hypothetical protein